VGIVLVVVVGAVMGFDIEMDSGLKMDYILDPVTCDKSAIEGNVLDLHYIGYLESGEQFDSSYDRQQPMKFILGAGQVIKGWEEGVLGMCVTEKRRLVIPPSLAYGDQGFGTTIPAGATLTFDVELMDSVEPPKPVNVFKQIDTNFDQAISKDEMTTFLKQEAETMQQAGGEVGQEGQKILDGQLYLNRVEEIFSHEDLDKDGFVSHAEFQGPKHDDHVVQNVQPPKPPNVFRQMDANFDQAISKDELTNYLKQQAESMHQAGGQMGEEGKKILEGQLYLNRVEEIFSHEDVDKDGFIAHAEFQGPKHDEL